MSDGRTSPWVWVGCGCAALVGLAVAAIGGIAWWGYREAKQLEQDFKDPVKRAEKTAAIVAYDELPEGYYPKGGISIPFLMDMAMFTDLPPEANVTPEDDDFDERGFFFMKIRQWDTFTGNDAEVRRFLRGEGDAPEALRDAQVEFESREVVAQGTLRSGGAQLTYQARRGVLATDQGEAEGVVNVFLVDCPVSDNYMRLGIWFGPEPNPMAPAAEADFTGTPADTAALKQFAGHFDFCRP